MPSGFVGIASLTAEARVAVHEVEVLETCAEVIRYNLVGAHGRRSDEMICREGVLRSCTETVR
jgi:hypothetical protein